MASRAGDVDVSYFKPVYNHLYSQIVSNPNPDSIFNSLVENTSLPCVVKHLLQGLTYHTAWTQQVNHSRKHPGLDKKPNQEYFSRSLMHFTYVMRLCDNSESAQMIQVTLMNGRLIDESFLETLRNNFLAYPECQGQTLPTRADTSQMVDIMLQSGDPFAEEVTRAIETPEPTVPEAESTSRSPVSMFR